MSVMFMLTKFLMSFKRTIEIKRKITSRHDMRHVGFGTRFGPKSTFLEKDVYDLVLFLCKKDETHLELLCAKRSRVSIKACKPPRHSCRCIPFQHARPNSPKPAKTLGEGDRACSRAYHTSTFDSWSNYVLEHA